jgi:hypothetical protein
MVKTVTAAETPRLLGTLPQDELSHGPAPLNDAISHSCLPYRHGSRMPQPSSPPPVHGTQPPDDFPLPAQLSHRGYHHKRAYPAQACHLGGGYIRFCPARWIPPTSCFPCALNAPGPKGCAAGADRRHHGGRSHRKKRPPPISSRRRPSGRPVETKIPEGPRGRSFRLLDKPGIFLYNIWPVH